MQFFECLRQGMHLIPPLFSEEFVLLGYLFCDVLESQSHLQTVFFLVFCFSIQKFVMAIR